MQPDPKLMQAVRQQHPLIHCISNIVTANDCANLVLAAGASPIMAQAPAEVAELAARAGALSLNTGTPSAEKFRACRLAGEAARAAGVPLVLDPVGVGASRWRLEQVRALLAACPPTILRANLGEAQALLNESSRAAWGVDSGNEGDRQAAAVALAKQTGAVVVLSGPVDVVADGEHLVTVEGGSALTRSLTGAGCMLSVLCGVFAAVTPDAFAAAATAAAFWKECAALAEQNSTGLGSFHAALFDAAGKLGK